MITLTHRRFKRIVSKMKSIIREEIDADFRHNLVEKAVTAGFDFDHMHALITSVPCEAVWQGDRCAEYLASNGFLSEVDATQVVEWLDEELGFLLDDDVQRPPLRSFEASAPTFR
ncbi:hypothetical protein [Sphingomonas sp. R1]|uniref:hypothetical protein n=1 Tax=Sphingomonas sp. R1 TaxID=399176 RepID=UPI002224A1FB|nr:hypothetical protein [Sphingomonas sp. R1]UYY76793.1 hypothetical protein OIM94_14965 [Sphingomonas sp. R1]